MVTHFLNKFSSAGVMTFSHNDSWETAFTAWRIINPQDRLYTFRISQFTGILRMFLRNIHYTLFTFQAKLRVLLMPWRNKPRNPLSFRANADPSAKCTEIWKRKKRRKTQKKWREITPLYTFHFSYFVSIFAYFARIV